VSPWILVWFIISIVIAAMLIGFLIALGRHALIVGRAAKEFSDEVSPLAREVSEGGTRASERASSLELPRASGVARRS
jgi:hypothetical protein